MTLAQLRDAVRGKLLDTPAQIPDARLTEWINEALQHVASWVMATQPTLLSASWDFSVSNPTARFVTSYALAAADPPPRLILHAERTDLGTNDNRVLPIIDKLQNFSGLRTGDLRDLPPIFISGPRRFGFIEPKNNIALTVFGVCGLDNMTDDADEPGETAAGGKDNVLPLEYQALIGTYATILGMASERRDTSDWQRIYDQERDQLLGEGTTINRNPERR